MRQRHRHRDPRHRHLRHRHPRHRHLRHRHVRHPQAAGRSRHRRSEPAAMRRRTGRRLPPCRLTRCRIGPAGYGRCTATGSRAAVMCGGLCAVKRARSPNQAEQSMKALTLRTPLARLNGSVIASRDPRQQKERHEAGHPGQGQGATNTVTARHPPQPGRPLAEQLLDARTMPAMGMANTRICRASDRPARTLPSPKARPVAWPTGRPNPRRWRGSGADG